MPNSFSATGVSCVLVGIAMASCSAARSDPCQLLTVEDVRVVDNSVAVASWAGRAGEKKDDEVCVFYTDDGDPRVMLFVWYDKKEDPKKLVVEGMTGTRASIVDLPGVQSGAASFEDNELKLLALKSTRGVVGLRVRKSVAKPDVEFEEVVQLARRALSRYQ